MKTNRTLLLTALATLLSTAALAEENKYTGVTVKPGGNAKGKATITIEINGKTEIREIELGNATRVELHAVTPDEMKKERATYLGIAMAEMTPVLADQLGLETGTGVVIGSVVPGRAAEKAGLQKNDVLVRFGDVTVKEIPQVQNLIAAHKEGDKVLLHFIRRAKLDSAEVTLGAEEREVIDTETMPLSYVWDPQTGLATSVFKRLPEGQLKLLGGNAVVSGVLDNVAKGISVWSKSIVVDPNGNVIESQDPAQQMRDAAKGVEKALRDAKIGEKTLEAVRDALNEAVKALDKARAPHGEPK